MNTLQIASASLFLFSVAGAQELVELNASDAASRDVFGQSISISGQSILIGAPGDNHNGGNSGSAYLFDNGGSAWVEGARLNAADSVTADSFGLSVGLSGDLAVIGARGDDHVNQSGNDEGSAYVFLRTGTSWAEEAKLVALSPAPGDYFGQSVSISNDTIAVGAPHADNIGADAGAVYVFVRSGTSWSQEAVLTASDGADKDLFGFSVWIDGDTLLVGAARDDDGGSNSGSAYVFVRTGTSWNQEAKLVATDAAAKDAFGRSVTCSGDTAVIGAHADDDAGLNSGSAYVYTRSGSIWTESAKLLPSDGQARAAFGWAVSIEADTIVVGAQGKSDAGTSSGAAYVFVGGGTSWSQSLKLVPSESVSADFFGSSVALSGGRVVVGAAWDDDAGRNSGSAHIFSSLPAPGMSYCFGDGTGTPCPCSASGSPGGGCANTTGVGGAALTAAGEASLGNDSFQLFIGGVPGSKPGLILRGANQLSGGLGIPIGDGLLCTSGQTARSHVQVTQAGFTNFSHFGGQPFGASSYGPGVVTNYQFWYRDPSNLCSGSGFNFSNAWTVAWVP